MTMAKTPDKPSTKHHQVDPRFAALLADDFGIPAATVLDALEGEPQRQAISICEWAARTDDPAFALLCWSKKHRRGRQRTGRRGHRESAEERTGRAGGNRPDAARPSDTSRRDESLRGVLDPARVRANLEKMGG
ncbi:MAG: hypothetical protein M3P49_00455 [Actinomycetota bacterium]|nr:hypothetical protein [Actinomycetota bacterium]